MAIATSTAILIGAAVAIGTTGYAARESNMAAKSAATAQGQQNTAQAAQLKMQAEAEKAQAQADELDRQQTLKRVLAAQTAVFGATGFDPMSTSFAGIQTSDTQKEALSRNLNQVFTDTRQVGIQNNILALGYDSVNARNAAKYANRARTIKAGGSMVSTGFNAYGDYRTAKARGD